MEVAVDASCSRKKELFPCRSGLLANKKGLCVLVVDDDPITRRIHIKLLEKFGIQTYAVENGKAAVEMCQSGLKFDLVLMDMEMPIMDGPEATLKLRAMGINNMIVGVTSRGLNSENQKFREAGLDDCHEKPLTSNIMDSLLQVLKNNGL